MPRRHPPRPYNGGGSLWPLENELHTQWAHHMTERRVIELRQTYGKRNP